MKLKLLSASLILLISFLLLGSSLWAEVGEEASKKPSPPFPEEIELPFPFSNWSSCDLSKKLYPAYDCKDGSMANDNVASIVGVKILKSGGKTFLIGIFERNEALVFDSKLIDIAAFLIQEGHLIIKAQITEGIAPDAEYKFTSETYNLNNQESAFGILHDQSFKGDSGENYLYLFRIKDTSIQEIFNREISVYWPYWGGDVCVSSIKITPVMSSKAMNDLKVTAKECISRGNIKSHRKFRLASTIETWRWNADKQRYEQLNKKANKKIEATGN